MPANASPSMPIYSKLARLYTTASGSRELVAKACSVLVFASVIQVGFWIGGQYGGGAVRVGRDGRLLQHGWPPRQLVALITKLAR